MKIFLFSFSLLAVVMARNVRAQIYTDFETIIKLYKEARLYQYPPDSDIRL
ncbi:MAG: hypothetical protein ACI9FG_001419 [Crocinitomicaceae bacterium]|jgi:hypothetical protein